ncbi:MAG TPA: choice-of-anchor D domain-containing protein [Dongiaceae bacterium]|nr:choice-of-anchor D domain-containing protein [Dongiaceae bacterium]
MSFSTLIRTAIAALILPAVLLSVASAQVSYSVTPPSYTFSATTVGTSSVGVGIIVKNTGSTTFTINSFTLSPLEFQLQDGWAPLTLLPGRTETYQIKFVPDLAQKFFGQLTFQLSGVSGSVVVPLQGNATTTGAVAQITPTQLNFGPQLLGTTSAPQTVTIKNVGTTNMKITAVAVDPPFSVTGFTSSVTLKPNQSLSVQVSYYATQPGTYTNTLVFTPDVLPTKGAALTATAVANPNLTVNSFPLLAAGTTAQPYFAALTAAGGQGTVTWSLAQGSALPAGLALSTSGTISGTLNSTVTAGNYNFVANISDSAGNQASQSFTLPIANTTGAKCGNITSYVANTSTPLQALTDLGTGTYLGSQGGLYPGGSNVRPADHDGDGVTIAQGIQPLDANGHPDPNGKYVLLAIGMSATHTIFYGMQLDAAADPTVNPHLVLVNGAQNDATSGDFALKNHGVWTDIFTYFLPQAGVTANQVVAAWVDDVGYPKGTFPADMSTLQSNLESIAQNLHSKFPNLKLAYFTSREYGGYSNSPNNTESPEPFAYESGFAVKWAIQDQLNGLASLNYDPSKGAVLAPWMAWGPYHWANGLTPNNDEFFWSCQDFTSDGIHPALPAGREKGGNTIMNFFKTDSTTTPWFLSH